MQKHPSQARYEEAMVMVLLKGEVTPSHTSEMAEINATVSRHHVMQYGPYVHLQGLRIYLNR